MTPNKDVPGAIIEDASEDEFRARHRGGALAIRLSCGNQLDYRTANLLFVVTKRAR